MRKPVPIHRCLALAVLFTIAGGLAQPMARAQHGPLDLSVEGESEQQRAARLTEAADKLYREGRYEQAAELYTRAHESIAAPELLFNIGQCYRGLDELNLAVLMFEQYLRAVPDTAQRASIERWIEQARARIAQERAATPKTRKDPDPLLLSSRDSRGPAVASVAAPVAPLAGEIRPLEPSELADGRAAPSSDDDRGLHERWWFWTIVGVAVAAGTTTVIMMQDDGDPATSSTTASAVGWKLP